MELPGGLEPPTTPGAFRRARCPLAAAFTMPVTPGAVIRRPVVVGKVIKLLSYITQTALSVYAVLRWQRSQVR